MASATFAVPPTRRTVAIRPDECLPSVAVRYAGEIGVTMDELLRFGLSLGAAELASLPTSPDAIAALSHLASLDPVEMVGRAYLRHEDSIRVGGLTLPSYLVEPAGRRIAPGVLRRDGEVPWIRLSWQLRCLPCDPETGEMLVERCSCGRLLTWIRCTSVHRCQACSADLRDLPVRHGSDNLVEIARTFAGLLGLGPPSRLRALNCASSIRLMMSLTDALPSLR